MNRHERRRAEREGRKTPQFLTKITTEQYCQHVNRIEDKAIKETLKVATAIMAMSLNNEFGFGKQRTQKLIDRMRLQYECIASNTITIADIIAWCEEQGIKFIV